MGKGNALATGLQELLRRNLNRQPSNKINFNITEIYKSGK